MKPTGFPTNETFVAGGLCASIDLPGTATTSHIVPATVGTRQLVLTVNASTVSVYEITFSTLGTAKIVNAVLRSSISLSGVNDVVYSTAEQLFLFAFTNTVQARALTLGVGTATLTAVPALGTFATTVERIADITVGEFKPGERSLVFSDEKSEFITVVPFTVNGGWRRNKIVTASYDTDEDVQTSADLAVGQFNDDDLLDVAVLDAGTGNVIIVRQQPPPCMTFITAPVHGMLALIDGSYEPISLFNRRMVPEVEAANAIRRPANSFRDLQGTDNASLCPVRFIDVRGHWEHLSGVGREMIVVGRASWIASDWIVWVPAPMVLGAPNPLSSPAMVPPLYWASAVWMSNATLGDWSAFYRFALGGIGFGAEIIGRSQSSAASLDAAQRLNIVLREAINDADGRMSEAIDGACTGNIFVDLLGHSRGGPVVTQALRRGFGERANYNFEVSTTILDAPDPSGWDNLRPWIRGGFIVGDPLITRVGSEWNSSFFSESSAGEIPVVDATEAWLIEDLIGMAPPQVTAVFPVMEVIRTDIIGLPIGRDRQAELELSERSFGAYQGPLGNIRHKEIFAGDPNVGSTNGIMWVEPSPEPGQLGQNNIRQPHPSLVNASEFTVLSSTHLGSMLADPRGFDPSFAVGFHTSTDFDESDEAACFPDDTNCGVPGPCTQQVTDAAGAESESRSSDGLLVRELVPDFDFRLAGGVAQNARVLTASPAPDVKTTLPNDELADLRTFITDTASTGWVADGTWQHTGTVKLNGEYPTLDDSMQPFVGASTDPDDLQAELEALSDDDLRDRIAGMSAAAAYATGKEDSWVDIVSGSVSTKLFPASLSAQQLLVRVEYDLGVSASAKLKLSLVGPGIFTSASWNSTGGTTRRVAELVVNRSGTFATGRDVVAVQGTDVRVFAVSVRPAPPVQVSGSTSRFELVLLEAGTSPARAAALASRSFYQGKRGRLARFTSTTVLDQLKADTSAWVDASSASGGEGTFSFSDSSSFPGSLWAATTSFTQPRPRGAQVHAWPGDGLRLGHTHPSTAIATQRAGFWVEYPAAGTSAARMVSSFAAAVSAFFAGAEGEGERAGDAEVVIEAAGEPSCLMLDGLDCLND